MRDTKPGGSIRCISPASLFVFIVALLAPRVRAQTAQQPVCRVRLAIAEYSLRDQSDERSAKNMVLGSLPPADELHNLAINHQICIVDDNADYYLVWERTGQGFQAQLMKATVGDDPLADVTDMRKYESADSLVEEIFALLSPSTSTAGTAETTHQIPTIPRGHAQGPSSCKVHFGIRWAWPPGREYTGSPPLVPTRVIQNLVVRDYLNDLKLAKKYPALCIDEDNPTYIVTWETSGFRMMVDGSRPIRSQTNVSGRVGDDNVQLNGSSVTWVPVQVPKDTYIEEFSVYEMDQSGCLNAPAVFGAAEYGGDPEKAAKKALKRVVDYLGNPAKAPAQTPIVCVPPERIGAEKP
jgi:hypothetical protein